MDTSLKKTIENLRGACKCGNLEAVRSILIGHPELVNKTDEFNSTPLYHASLCGHKDVLECLLKNGACHVPGTVESDRCYRAAQDTDVRNILSKFQKNPFALLSSNNKGKTPYQEFLSWLYNTLPNPDVTLCSPASNGNSDTGADTVGVREFKAHRAVLMARSTHLRNILQDNKWSQKQLVYLEGEEARYVHLFMEYLYTGQFQTERTDIELLANVAKMLQLQDLASQLQQHTKQEKKRKKKRAQNQKVYIPGATHIDKVRSDFAHFFSMGFPQICKQENYPETDLFRSFSENLIVISVEKEQFNCHKPFLTGRSEYFHSLIKEKELHVSAGPASLTIDNISASTFSTVLLYIYSETILPEEKGLNTMLNLLKASVQFTLPELTKICCERIEHSISTATVLTVLSVSRQLQVHILSSACFTFLAKNMQVMLNTEELTHFLANEIASSRSTSLQKSVEVVDNMAAFLIQINDENSSCVKLFSRKLSDMNIYCDNFIKPDLSTQNTSKSSKRNSGEKPDVSQMAMICATTDKTKTHINLNGQVVPIKDTLKPHRPKINQVGCGDWSNILQVEDNGQPQSLISLPNWATMKSGVKSNEKPNANISSQIRNQNEVHFNYRKQNNVPILPKQHSQCCTIL